MYLNTWGRLTLVCGNHGDDYTNKMILKEYLGSKHDTVFYACPRFISIYQQKEGRSCNNRLTIKESEKLLNKLMELSQDGPEEVNLTGYKWTTSNGIEYHVLKHDKTGFTVSVLNRRAIKS